MSAPLNLPARICGIILLLAACSEPQNQTPAAAPPAEAPASAASDTPPASPNIMSGADDQETSPTFERLFPPAPPPESLGQTFSGLKVLKAPAGSDAAYEIWYRPELSEVINQALPANEHSEIRHRALRTRLDGGNTWYIFDCSNGPSYDPYCQVLREESSGRLTDLGAVGGERLYLPGNGHIYHDGLVNQYHRTRTKYSIQSGKLQETAQPFYYVGLPTQARTDLTLYNRPGSGRMVATLPVGSTVTILLRAPYDSEDESGRLFFLVKNEFGLVGWVTLESGSLEDDVLAGIRFYGD